MLLLSSNLYRDMFNFFRNQFIGIILLAFLTALISFILDYVLFREIKQLTMISDNISIHDITNMNFQQFLQQMTIEQKKIFLKTSIFRIFTGLMNNILLTNGLMTMLNFLSKRHPMNISCVTKFLILLLPRLILLTLFTTLLIQLGIFLMIVPGLLLAIFFSLSPIIISSTNFGVLKSMILSIKLVFLNIRLVSPIVLSCLLAKLVLFLLATKLSFSSLPIVTILLNGSNNLILSFMLIYLYRFYMLINKID